MSPHATSDTVPCDIFFKLVRPSFHKEFDEEDMMGVFKRSVFVVFTEVGIYIRLPGTKRDPVKRHAWPEDDVGMISPAARPTLAAYKKGNFTRPPASYDQDLQLSLNRLQAGLDGEDVPFCTTTKGTELFSGRKCIEEGRPTLAGIDGKTKYYLNEEPESATELPAKRLRAVKSSEAFGRQGSRSSLPLRLLRKNKWTRSQSRRSLIPWWTCPPTATSKTKLSLLCRKSWPWKCRR